MKVEYPILPSDGVKTDELTEEQLNERYYGHNNSFGFYPIGRLNSWHGGIHIERSSRVRAIADGRIIAYRFPKKLLNEKDTERTYSNGFILVQHNFKIRGKEIFRFYSLYMHLQPKVELEKSNGKNIPELYAKYTAKVTAKEQRKGLNARSGSETTITTNGKNKIGKIVQVIYKDELVIYDLSPKTKSKEQEKRKLGVSFPADHWIHNFKDLNYIPITYKGKDDLFIASSDGRIGKANYDQIKVLVEEDTDDKAVKGAIVRNEPKSTAKYIKTIKTGTDIGEVEKVANGWVKLKGKEEYIKKDSLKLTATLRDDIKTDTVANVDITINAGDIIGIPSKFAFEKQKSYNAMHLEVFTDDSRITNFINNTAKHNDRTTYEVPNGKTLQIAKPCNFLKEKIKVKIYEIEDSYAQIGFESIKNITLPVKGNIYTPNKDGENGEIGYSSETGYYIYDFDTVNKHFNNALEKGISVIKRMKNGGSGKDLNRKVEYIHPKAGKKYWVNSTDIDGKKGDWIELNKSILSYYQEKPKTSDLDIVINETDIEGIPIIKKEGILDNNNTEWYKVQGRKKHKDKKGWIKKEDLTEKNPYNWQEYGWQLKENTGTQYFYQFGDLVQDSEPHQFIKDIWAQVDTDGDKVLSIRELQRAISKKEKTEVLSKLICKHPNEWNTWQNIASFKQEVEAIYQKGIEQEEEPGQKQALETARDEKIALLEDKIEKLCFWDKIKDGDVAKPKEETKTDKPKRSFRPQEPEVKKESTRIKRTFPSDSSAIYHFHPIAFVQHMKLITAPTIPPWLEVALKEALLAKGVKEWNAPLKSMIKKYHTYVGLPNNSYGTAWCSSFVSWCLKESNIDNPKTAASRFYLSDDPKYKKHSASLIKRISSSSYGALALYSDCSSTGTVYSAGHIGIVYGFITDEKTGKEYLALLGGNQGDRLKVSRYDFSGNVFHSYTDKNGKKHYKKFRGFYWPIKGGIIPSHVPKDNYFKSATEANKKILNQEIKDSKDGESSR